MERTRLVEVEVEQLIGKTIRYAEIEHKDEYPVRLNIECTDGSKFQVNICHDGSYAELVFYRRYFLRNHMIDIAIKVGEEKLSTMELQEIMFANPWITLELIEEIREEERRINYERLVKSNDGQMMLAQTIPIEQETEETT